MDQKFLWGVSTSGYQHEGGYNMESGPKNNWYDWERMGKIPPSDLAADFWNQYEGDFDRATGLGLNAIRLSLEWSRVQPDNARDWDEKACEHYGKILTEARVRGLEPLVTLFHFTHPYWLGTDPWLEEDMQGKFLDYLTGVLKRVNEYLITKGQAPLKWLITVNEPNMLSMVQYVLGTFPSARRRDTKSAALFHANLLRAHIAAYAAIHRLYEKEGWGEPMVSFNNYCVDVYWLDKASVDFMVAPERGVSRADAKAWLIEESRGFYKRLEEARIPLKAPVSGLIAWVAREMDLRKGSMLMEMGNWEKAIDQVFQLESGRALDYVAIDFYDPFVGNSLRMPRFGELSLPVKGVMAKCLDAIASKWWDWVASPDGLRFFVQEHMLGHSLPLIIAENGMASYRGDDRAREWRKDRLTRAQYLERILSEVKRLGQENERLRGYFYWSLTDNYEWGTYSARFGLYGVDFSDPRRPRNGNGTSREALEVLKRLIAASSSSVKS